MAISTFLIVCSHTFSRENAGKMRTRVTPNTGTFYAVTLLNAQCNKRWNIYFCLQVSIKFMFNANQRKHLRRILGNRGNYNRNNDFYEIFYSPTQNVFTSQLPYSVTQTFLCFRNTDCPVCSQCTLSLPPENMKKSYSFLMFHGVEKRCIGNKWINNFSGR